MKIEILVVTTPHAAMPWRSPLIIAKVDDCLVKYSRRDGYTCTCDTEGDECAHVDAIDELIDERVFAETAPPTKARVPSRSRR